MPESRISRPACSMRRVWLTNLNPAGAPGNKIAPKVDFGAFSFHVPVHFAGTVAV